MKPALLIGLIFLSIALPASTDLFRDLNFEAVNPRVLPSDGSESTASITDLLPGWQAFSGTTELTTIGYNFSPFISRPGYVSIVDAKLGNGFVPYEGSFSLRIMGNYESAPPIWIQQVGDIPSFARRMFVTYSGLGLDVRIDGQPVLRASINPGETYPTYSTFSAEYDLTPFAGRQNALLTIGPGPDPGFQGGSILDNIIFAVPEPGTNALLAVGAVVLACHGGRKRRKQVLKTLSSKAGSLGFKNPGDQSQTNFDSRR